MDLARNFLLLKAYIFSEVNFTPIEIVFLKRSNGHFLFFLVIENLST